MARAPRDPRNTIDRPGQRPLLQGHLRRGGRPDPAVTALVTEPSTPDIGAPDASSPASASPEAARSDSEADGQPSAQPAAATGSGQAAAKRGKATRSPAEVVKRPHLEGPEQGPK